MDITNYAKSPADIKATAELIAATYSFDEAILAGAICSALVMERERCASVAEHLNGWGSDAGAGGHAEHIAAVIRGGSNAR